MLNNIPVELQALPQWVCWRYEEVDGKQTKIPYSAKAPCKASPTNPSTWSDFQTAVKASKKFNGIGFVLSKDDPYAIIDLDNKPHNPCTPEQQARHNKIYEHVVSYTERSTSGTGIHIVVRGQVPTGVHRDNVEIYSDARYMIFTGDIIRNLPIQDCQQMLDLLYGEMQPPKVAMLDEQDEEMSDRDLVEMAMNATNADKFNRLCRGEWQGSSEYPSQSEADFALLSILAFYTPSNAQVRRIFHMTELGKREKAIRNNTYLDFALGKIRGNEAPPVDLSQFKANIVPPEPQSIPDNSHLSLPPGLIGELARYFYQTSIRPVPEIALAAAIALAAGICGRSYNISDTGLNQYVVLLAKTGTGKEAALSGIEKLISAVKQQIPVASRFIGPAAFASGQALIRVLDDRPCFVSILGEFGLTLQQLSDHRANGAEKMLKKVLLDLFAKSGWHQTLHSSVYSDTEKNTKDIQAPCLTILGESTPEAFFDGLDVSHIAEGLIPRFLIMEYTGDRVPRNKHAHFPPSKELIQQFTDFITASLTITNNSSMVPVGISPEATVLLDALDLKADTAINTSKDTVEVQLWNRAHLKALKLAGLLAVGVNVHKPVVSAEQAKWAIDFVMQDVKIISGRFKKGDVGTGDSKQMHDLRRIIDSFLKKPSDSEMKNPIFVKMSQGGIVPHVVLSRRSVNVASFKNDKAGATMALKRVIQSMIESGMLIEVPKLTASTQFQSTGVLYGIGSNWKN